MQKYRTQLIVRTFPVSPQSVYLAICLAFAEPIETTVACMISPRNERDKLQAYLYTDDVRE